PAQRERDVRRQHLVAAPLAGGERRVPLVEPPRREVVEELVQRQVRELVPQGGARGTRVRAGVCALEDDASLVRKGERAPPFGCYRAGVFPEPPAVGRDDNQNAVSWPREPGKRVGRQRVVQQRAGQRLVARLRDDGEASALDAHAAVLGVQGRGDGTQQSYPERGGEPPASTGCRMSAHRFPPGLNLFACTPSRQACRPPS